MGKKKMMKASDDDGVWSAMKMDISATVPVWAQKLPFHILWSLEWWTPSEPNNNKSPLFCIASTCNFLPGICNFSFHPVSQKRIASVLLSGLCLIIYHLLYWPFHVSYLSTVVFSLFFLIIYLIALPCCQSVTALTLSPGCLVLSLKLPAITTVTIELRRDSKNTPSDTCAIVHVPWSQWDYISAG